MGLTNCDESLLLFVVDKISKVFVILLSQTCDLAIAYQINILIFIVDKKKLVVTYAITATAIFMDP